MTGFEMGTKAVENLSQAESEELLKFYSCETQTGINSIKVGTHFTESWIIHKVYNIPMVFLKTKRPDYSRTNIKPKICVHFVKCL